MNCVFYLVSDAKIAAPRHIIATSARLAGCHRVSQFTINEYVRDFSLVMCKKLVASVDRFDKVVPLTEFLGEDNLPGKPLLVRFVNRSLDVISF